MMDSAQVLSLWENKVAVITGGSSGIGSAIAQSLASSGLQVVIGARRQEKQKEVAESIMQAGGICFAYPLDMKSEASICDFFRIIGEQHGGTDILINNAGLGHQASLLSGSADAWREMLDVNVLGLSIATQAAAQDMISRNAAGCIIHISSMAAHRVPSNSGMYSASKFAVRSLTESLRQELWAQDLPIRVSSISPAFVETEFAEKYSGDAQKAAEIYGAYRVLQTDDIANAVRYILQQPLDVQIHDILLRPRRQEN
jgi:17beta-estradiol 17-dehydrogenase / 3beta-hydroxysteroid 3-dehydrogenase